MVKKQIEKVSQGLLSDLQKADLSFFRPVVFWSVNSSLEEKELVRQLREMKEYGLGGVVFHARAGLTTEYLSEAWFHLVGVCLKEAKRLGLQVWMYDEFGWPSGFVAGRLLSERENCARYLEYEVKDSFDPAAYAVYSLEGGIPRRLREGEQAPSYHTLYLRYSDAYADILNPAVTEQFIAATHEQYYSRFQESFGKELIGFFTDEPQYYRYATPMSGVTESAYFEAYGEDLKEELLYLFIEDEKGYPFRVKFYNLMNRLYCENFYGKLYDWCKAHGCMLTGHSVEETYFFTQMWGGADCASSYLYEHIPAIDNLGKHSSAVIAAGNVGSVAAQTGVNLAMTETFGCSGYAAVPRELRLIADKQYVRGVNLMCQHLYNYSLAGQGKTDHPLFFGRTLPWAAGYKTFNDYYARLGWLLASSREEVSVAVLSPMESVYLDYRRLNEDSARNNVDEGFAEIAVRLRENGVAYHFVNEKVFEKLGGIENGRLVVGKFAYEAVVVANCRELKQNTVELLSEFLKEGGRLAIEGTPPAYVEGVKTDLSCLKSNIAIKELPKPFSVLHADLAYTCRTLKNGKRFIFAVNEGNKEALLRLSCKFSPVDLENCRGYAASDCICVPPFGSVLLEENGQYFQNGSEFCDKESIVPEWAGSSLNNLTVENVTVTLKNGKKMSGYVYGVYETLIKSGYEGEISVRFTFSSDAPRYVQLIAEKQGVNSERFNGEPIHFAQSDYDVNFKTARVHAEQGENHYEYKAVLTDTERVRSIFFGAGVPESLRNCFSLQTFMEPIYIEGDFDSENFAISAPKPKTAGNLTAQGYENFCGAARYEFTLRGAGRFRLEPVGSYSMCEFRCKGRQCAALLNGFAELEVEEGEHRITVLCYSTMRNRFGPFHCVHNEELGLSPANFTLPGWTDENTNPSYCAERKLVPFGLEKIIAYRLK